MTRAAKGKVPREKKSPAKLNQKDNTLLPLDLNKTEFSLLGRDDTVMSQDDEDIDTVDSESANRPKYCGKINRSIPQPSEIMSFRPEKVIIQRHKKESMVGPMKLSHRLSLRITNGGLCPLKSPIIAKQLHFSEIKTKKPYRPKRKQRLY